MSWYLAVLSKYADFSGRSRRMEYWMFALMNIVISIAIAIVMAIAGGRNSVMPGLIMGCYSLFVFIPSIAVAVRRLHDIGRSGWWLFIGFIPLLGGIVLLIFSLQDSEPGPNEYGPNPKTAFA
ncbi:MAG TPA: DUF805 domain-containing protein [Gemmatimonadaceae bacterium]|nr:DUF805 domain-containing protein [Gemmatimonadaceae bacterium]